MKISQLSDYSPGHNLEAKLNHLSCRILPLSWVASSTTIPMPSSKAYARLAKETYDKCPIEPPEVSSPYASSSVVELAQSIPKSLSLKLTSEITQVLPKGDTIFHIAYSWGIDRQWLSSSTTDSLGKQQWKASYCLGPGVVDLWNAFRDICNQILETALDMMRKEHFNYRLFVIKDQVMAQEESDSM